MKKSIFGFMALPLILSANLSDISDAEASKFLQQSTFGPTTKSIADLKTYSTYESWIDNQIERSKNLLSTYVIKKDNEEGPNVRRLNTGYINASFAQLAGQKKDQLRQRMAYALSEIWVTGDFPGLPSGTVWRALTYDKLIINALGNYKDVMRSQLSDLTMGRYLTSYNNKVGQIDENLARETLQLFTMGMFELNKGGKVKGINYKKGTNNPIRTYSEEDVVAFAKIISGWDRPSRYQKRVPLICHDKYHDQSEKVFMGEVYPANQGCNADFEQALEQIFQNKNTAIFISKQLIQKFVSSNPRKSYVKDVVKVFEDNGEGVRGDLAAVIKAILLHEDARKDWSNKSVQGKIKEPLIRLFNLLRATNSFNMQPLLVLESTKGKIGQMIMDAPSVFNYFSPLHAPSGFTKGKVAPELQMATDAIMLSTSNYYYYLSENLNENKDSRLDLMLEAKFYKMIKDEPKEFIEHFNILLYNGRMAEVTKEAILAYLDTVPYPEETISQEKIDSISKIRAGMALFLMMSDPRQNYLK